MDYYKVSIDIEPYEEWLRDVLMAQLADIGFESFTETISGLEAFIPATGFKTDVVSELLLLYEDNFSFKLDKELIKSQNWNEVWEKNYFRPLIVAGECLVRAPFHTDFPRCTYEIVIEPNMAFGTGNHETTAMMLEAILRENLDGKTVLDMGCGTGILGILASMKGAGKIMAIDIDEWSVKGTLENSVLNQVQNLTVQQGDASLLGGETFDIILANIQKNVLMNDMAAYASVLNQAGKLFVSGFYAGDLGDIIKIAEKEGLKSIGHTEKNQWIAAFFVKS